MKVGVRGDWRFTHENLLKLVRSHMHENTNQEQNEITDNNEPDRYPLTIAPSDPFVREKISGDYLNSVLAMQEKAQGLQHERGEGVAGLAGLARERLVRGQRLLEAGDVEILDAVEGEAQARPQRARPVAGGDGETRGLG